jgi:hypothetical protein
VAHAFLEGIAVVHSLLWRFVGGGHRCDCDSGE